MNQHSQGFTLIEVLVALLIIAYVGLSSQQRISQFFDDRDHLLSRQHAHWVAWDELMLQYQIAQGWYPNNQTKPEKRGQHETMGRTWFYQTSEEQTVTNNFYRYETSVADTAFREVNVGEVQRNNANLVMFLVKE